MSEIKAPARHAPLDIDELTQLEPFLQRSGLNSPDNIKATTFIDSKKLRSTLIYPRVINSEQSVRIVNSYVLDYRPLGKTKGPRYLLTIQGFLMPSHLMPFYFTSDRESALKKCFISTSDEAISEEATSFSCVLNAQCKRTFRITLQVNNKTSDGEAIPYNVVEEPSVNCSLKVKSNVALEDLIGGPVAKACQEHLGL